MIKTFKTRLLLDHEQRTYFEKAFGIRRWTWNWACQEYFRQAADGKYPTHYDMQKQLNNPLVLDPAYSWLTEVNSMVRQESLKDFGLCIKAWHKLQAKSRRTMEQIDSDKGKPKFQKKGACPDSFRLINKSNPVKYVSPHFVSMTRTKGFKPFQLQTAEKVTCLKGIEVKTATVSREHGQYYIAFTFERTNQKKRTKGTGTVGIDLGVKHAAVTYDGKHSTSFDLPKTIWKAQERVARCQRNLATKTKGSKRYANARLRLEKAFAHQAAIRRDFLAKLTTELVSSYDTIKVDDFSFTNYVKMQEPHKGRKGYHKATRKAYWVAPYTLKLMLEYKCEERGNTLIYIPRGTPTTKTCSACGEKHAVALSERTYECHSCGLVIDRDTNAAINVYNYA